MLKESRLSEEQSESGGDSDSGGRPTKANRTGGIGRITRRRWSIGCSNSSVQSLGHVLESSEVSFTAINGIDGAAT